MKTSEIIDLLDQRYGDPIAFSVRVKRTMWDSGITVTALAEEAGYSVGNVSRWLNLRREPALKTMLVLDRALERLLEDR